MNGISPYRMPRVEIIIQSNVRCNSEYGYQRKAEKAHAIVERKIYDLIWLISNNFVWSKAKQLAQTFYDQCGFGDFHIVLQENWLFQDTAESVLPSFCGLKSRTQQFLCEVMFTQSVYNTLINWYINDRSVTFPIMRTDSHLIQLINERQGLIEMWKNIEIGIYHQLNSIFH